jgi:tetratricopeptide (TPR) repeat protein
MLHSLAHLYDVAGLYREGIGLLAAAESRLPSSAAQLIRGRLLSWIGRFHYHIGEYEAAQQTLAAASDLLRPLDAPDALALALTYRGEAARSAGDFAAARRYQTESAALARAAGSVQVETLALLHSGKVEIAEGKYQAAQAAAEIGLNLAGQTAVAAQLLAFAAAHPASWQRERAEARRLLAEVGGSEMDGAELTLATAVRLAELRGAEKMERRSRYPPSAV